MSKNARKRLAKLTSKTSDTAAAASNSVIKTVDSISVALPAASEKVNGVVGAVKQKGAELVEGVNEGATHLANGQMNGTGETASKIVHDVEEKATEAQGVAAEAVHREAEVTSIANGTLEALPSVSLQTDLKPVEQPQPQAPSSKFLNPSSTFAPTLPESLPILSANTLPANRKRKTPQDFTPSGPGRPNAVASPSKSGVKFEDGVLPGDGLEGERILTPKTQSLVAEVKKKDRNLIERTVWTFIMIGGFISELRITRLMSSADWRSSSFIFGTSVCDPAGTALPNIGVQRSDNAVRPSGR